MRTVCVIGGGTMGFAIALAFAAQGPVRIVGRSAQGLQATRRRLQEAAGTLVEEGVLDDGQAQERLCAIQTTTDLRGGVQGAQWVIDAIPERLDQKRQLFAQLEQMLPDDALITSTTSTLPITRLAEGARKPGRMLVTHFVNPPHIVPLVEVVAHPATPRQTTDGLVAALRDAGFSPIVLQRDILGFVGNRLQMALVREALHLLRSGVVGASEIDLAVTDGLGLRWAFKGPFETADFGGLDTWEQVCANLAPELANEMELEPIRTRVARGQLGLKTGQGFYSYAAGEARTGAAERDRMLLRLRKLRGEV